MSKASTMKEACVAVNHFLQDRFPDGNWTSLAVILNPHTGLHRDMGNMIGMCEHLLTSRGSSQCVFGWISVKVPVVRLVGQQLNLTL